MVCGYKPIEKARARYEACTVWSCGRKFHCGSTGPQPFAEDAPGALQEDALTGSDIDLGSAQPGVDDDESDLDEDWGLE